MFMQQSRSKVLGVVAEFYKASYLLLSFLYFTLVFQLFFILCITLYYIEDRVHQPMNYDQKNN